ncbi:MAG: ParB/RepB/Spo0J family partition protein [Deltaproteobacteria bacterium]|nr:ParB/RepB/Spo0J family partition protein [Deltaproteobacteria bacterium]
MSKKDSLGKGLGAIFSDLIDETPDKPNFIMCGIEELIPNKFQPRKFFDGEEQKNLVTSIKKNGIIQPIIVRKLDSGYEIIAGERRWRAAQAAQLKTVPVIIKEADDIEVAELSLIENIQREDLNPIEEAQAYLSLINTFRLSQEEISVRTGKDRSTIANFVRLLKLPAEIQDALVQKTISAGHARALLSLNSREEQVLALKDIVRKRLNVRQTENAVKTIKRVPSDPVKREKSREIIDIENQLSKIMMTSVKINQRNKGGTIKIRYRDLEDLDRLIRHIVDV